MNQLAARKQLLVREAKLHREILALEGLNIRETVDRTRVNLQSNRWWLIGGFACAGWLLSGRLAGISRWIPAATTAARIVQRLRG